MRARPRDDRARLRVIHVTRLARAFPGPPRRPLFSGLDLDVARGEIVAILGESGSGKSTLLNLLAGLDLPDEGNVTVDGVALPELDDDARTRFRRERIGFVFQAFHVLPYLTVAQNVALPLALNGVPAATHDARVAELLAAVGLGERGGSMPRELSGGELQRVATARALVHAPAVVLADEPTGNLDPRTAATVIALLRDTLKARSATGVLVTHSRAAASIADRVLALTPEGLVPAAGTP
ncbi:MAG: ABC transporter ATP-binding protein [Burkholderiales bacterium]|nr:ABC transporter ATP-binding protein [Burkholderiales bacterium]MCE7876923.1 ABC transporter ATP-binding protein [Betaproteobacteria bacterium PRO3]